MNLEQLTFDAIAARDAADAACGAAVDSGSCNLDAMFFCLPKGMRSAPVVRAFQMAGLQASVMRWIGRGVMVQPPGVGQAGKRFASNQALCKHLIGAGWPVSIYYQMD